MAQGPHRVRPDRVRARERRAQRHEFACILRESRRPVDGDEFRFGRLAVKLSAIDRAADEDRPEERARMISRRITQWMLWSALVIAPAGSANAGTMHQEFDRVAAPIKG